MKSAIAGRGSQTPVLMSKVMVKPAVISNNRMRQYRHFFRRPATD